MRSKEYSHDYRYFPEPDLPPIQISEAWIAEIAREMPEMADEKTRRYVEEYQLPLYDAQVLTEDREIAVYFEETILTAKDKKAGVQLDHGEVIARSQREKRPPGDLPDTPTARSC
jgi:aspartyl-tRNA(Asn)/glutamyl-tRNA(Gln) amidotransferase subunit B